MMVLKKINQIVDIFENANAGIFKALKDLVDTNQVSELFEWLDNYEELDIDYYVSHSGEKYASRFYLTMIDHEKTISDIAKIIFNRFSEKWDKTYQAMMMEYNPINNYDMVESEKVNSKIKSTVGTDTKAYGFGSSTPAPTDEASSTSTTEGSKDDNFRELTRSGNIGVTTSAQLLEGEIEVRKNIFIESVMKDIDSIMCLEKY